MNVKSQATIAYAYALGNVKVKNITTSNVVNTYVKTVGLLAKKMASSDYFKPLDIIAYTLVIQNPGNSDASEIIVSEDLSHQKLIDDSIKYSLLDDGKINVKVIKKDHNLHFEIDELKAGNVLILSYQVEIEEINDININLKNPSNLSCKEVLPFTTNKVDVVQKYAKLLCEKKTVDSTYLNSDISYQLIIKNTGNTIATDIEVIDQLPFTFELQKSPNAIILDNENVDIYTFDQNSHILKFIVDKIEPYSGVEINIKGKIVK